MCPVPFSMDATPDGAARPCRSCGSGAPGLFCSGIYIWIWDGRRLWGPGLSPVTPGPFLFQYLSKAQCGQRLKFSFSNCCRVGIQCKLVTSAWPGPRQSGSLETEGGAGAGPLLEAGVTSPVLKNLVPRRAWPARVQNSPVEQRKHTRAAGDNGFRPRQGWGVGVGKGAVGEGSHKDPKRGWRQRDGRSASRIQSNGSFSHPPGPRPRRGCALTTLTRA